MRNYVEQLDLPLECRELEILNKTVPASGVSESIWTNEIVGRPSYRTDNDQINELLNTPAELVDPREERVYFTDFWYSSKKGGKNLVAR